VKGAYAGKNSLCCEWVASRLARLLVDEEPLGLPPFRMADVPRELIQGSVRPDIRDLGAGRVFASTRIEGGQELNWLAAQGWPDETMAMVLLIDLWVQNEDRSLSPHGGNPNLLVEWIPEPPHDDPEGPPWKAASRREQLWVYDFNLAFDEDFKRGRFFGAHVFGKMLKKWPAGFRERTERRMRGALGEVEEIFAELPPEWLHVDGDDSLPVQLDMDGVISTLELPFADPETFWTLP